MIYKIPAVDLNIWLNMFGEEVKAGRYKKILYSIWRNLITDINNINTFELEQTDDSLCIVIKTPLRGYTFLKNDGSFGEFLSRSVYMEQYIDIPYTYSTTDKVTWDKTDMRYAISTDTD